MPTFIHQHHRLFYRQQGNGPLLLILPGNTSSSTHHEGELAYFGKRYHAASLDFRGTGRSERLVEWPDNWFELAAHDAAALVAHLGQEKAIVIGTSGGAIVALLMAILHPDSVRAVVADSSVEFYPSGSLSKSVAERSQRTPGQVGFWQHAHGDDWQQVVDADSDMLLRIERNGGDIYRARLKDIYCPVLLTASLRDDLLPGNIGAQICSMAWQISGSGVYFKDSGYHPLMWSQSDEFRAICTTWLSLLEDEPTQAEN